MEPGGDLVSLHRRAVDAFGALVGRVGADQWQLPTPCADWDVRQLVNHLAGENAWTAPLLAGRTIAEVGDRFDGDHLGDDPTAAFAGLAAEAAAAVAEAGALDRTVHVSFGDIPGREYVSQLTSDHVVHAWDLARGIGADEELDPELVAWAWSFLGPQVDQWRSAGVFGPAVEAAPGADLLTRLLAATGRAR